MQGFNMGRYIPPDLEGLKSFNQASGKPPTKRNPDGSQTVRFECPFPIWCTTCHPEQIIGQGVRFNAEKSRVGSYYSTPIWRFCIKHTVCGGEIEVRTDPKNTEYVVVSGGRRRAEPVGPLVGVGGELGIGPDVAAAKSLAKDGAFGALEKKVEDKEVADKNKVRIEELRKRSERDWSDPYMLNKRIRADFRVGRRRRQDDERTGTALQDKFGLGLDLVAPDGKDAEHAKLIDYGDIEGVNVAARGIFEVQEVPTQVAGKDLGKKGKNDKIGVVAVQRSKLQNGLKGNTRVKNDPFLKGEDVWKPATRRKKDEPLLAASPGSQTRRQDRPATDEGLKSTTNSTATTTTTTTTATLVAYDSD